MGVERRDTKGSFTSDVKSFNTIACGDDADEDGGDDNDDDDANKDVPSADESNICLCHSSYCTILADIIWSQGLNWCLVIIGVGHHWIGVGHHWCWSSLVLVIIGVGHQWRKWGDRVERGHGPQAWIIAEEGAH